MNWYRSDCPATLQAYGKRPCSCDGEKANPPGTPGFAELPAAPPCDPTLCGGSPTDPVEWFHAFQYGGTTCHCGKVTR